MPRRKNEPIQYANGSVLARTAGRTSDVILFPRVTAVRCCRQKQQVARTAIVAIVYIAGAATSLFVSIRRTLSLSGPSSSSGGGGSGGSTSSSWVGRVLGCLIRGVGGGGGRGTPGARTAGPRTLTDGGAPAAAAPSAVIIVPTVFTATTTTTTTTGGGGGGSDTAAGGGVGGGRRVPPRLSRILSNTDRFVANAHENTEDVLVAVESL